jgi:hypothetical protein
MHSIKFTVSPAWVVHRSSIDWGPDERWTSIKSWASRQLNHDLDQNVTESERGTVVEVSTNSDGLSCCDTGCPFTDDRSTAAIHANTPNTVDMVLHMSTQCMDWIKKSSSNHITERRGPGKQHTNVNALNSPFLVSCRSCCGRKMKRCIVCNTEKDKYYPLIDPTPPETWN